MHWFCFKWKLNNFWGLRYHEYFREFIFFTTLSRPHGHWQLLELLGYNTNKWYSGWTRRYYGWNKSLATWHRANVSVVLSSARPKERSPPHERKLKFKAKWTTMWIIWSRKHFLMFNNQMILQWSKQWIGINLFTVNQMRARELGRGCCPGLPWLPCGNP